MCLMNGLELRMEIVNGIFKILKWFIALYSTHPACAPSLGPLGATALGGR